jgi:hypothetical protein
MAANANASKCVEYLRYIGIEVTDEQAQAWITQEKRERQRRRAHNREVKRSCGHFRTHDTRIFSDKGAVLATYCSECRLHLRSVPLLYTPSPPRIA